MDLCDSLGRVECDPNQVGALGPYPPLSAHTSLQRPAPSPVQEWILNSICKFESSMTFSEFERIAPSTRRQCRNLGSSESTRCSHGNSIWSQRSHGKRMEEDVICRVCRLRLQAFYDRSFPCDGDLLWLSVQYFVQLMATRAFHRQQLCIQQQQMVYNNRY